MSSELRQVLEEVNVGISPDEALEAMGTRIPCYDLGLMVSAISVQRQTGGNLAEVLENLAATVRERRRVRGEVMALTTGPRVSSYVLAAVPVCLFLYFFAISKDYRDVMTGTTYGWMLLGTAGVLATIGFVTSRKVAIVEY
jgi:tight adherence protein B